MTVMVVEVRLGMSAGRCVFIENLASGAGIDRIFDLVLFGVLHDLIKKMTPMAQFELCARKLWS
jgi:hypothetical protein